MEFKDNLYEFRKNKGFSQEELAALCHVSRQAVSKWENGSSKPDSDNLILLAKYLEVSTDSLLGIEKAQEKETEYQPFMEPYKIIDYTSKWKIGSIPLVDIYFRVHRYYYGYHIGMSTTKGRCAKGIIAIGNRAIGVFTLSLIGCGFFSIGIVNIGLICSLGLLSMGAYAFGIAALGYFAFGVLAFGMYTFGVISCALQIAVGVVTYSQDVAVGLMGSAKHFIQLSNGRTCVVREEDVRILKDIITQSQMPGFIKYLLESLRLC